MLKMILTNRLNGVSKKPYDSLNLAYHVGDDKRNVDKNRLKILNEYFLDSIESSKANIKDSKNKTLLYLNQIHSNHIFVVSKGIVTLYKDDNTHSFNIESLQKQNLDSNFAQINLGNADGIICDSSEYVALVMMADCNGVLIMPKSVRFSKGFKLDSKMNFIESNKDLKKCFALLHAGRAGLQSKILTNALNILESKFNLKASELSAFVSPSIRACCYEIGDKASEFAPKYITQNRLDMIAMLRDELEGCGVSDINISNICTCCDTSYFSHRRHTLNKASTDSQNTADSIKHTDSQNTGRFGIFASIYKI